MSIPGGCFRVAAGVLTKDIKCCMVGTMCNATTSYACPVDNRACEVVALFASKMPGNVEDIVGKVAWWLPCNRCRDMERDARALLKVRLGKYERRALLLAAGYHEDHPKVVPPRLRGRAADESNRRAIRKLGSVGLLILRWRKVPSKSRRKWGGREGCSYHKRAVWRTPLGDAVVKRLRDKLKTDSPIRWAGHIEPIIVAVRAESDALLSDFRGLIENEENFERQRMHLAAQGAQMGGDRELLTKAIRKHFENVEACKASLKAIEESRR